MKKYNTLLYSMFFFIFLSSCDLIGKIDDIKPEYQLEEDNVISDEETANNVVRDVYVQWRNRGITPFRAHMGFYSGSLISKGGFEGDKGFSENNVDADNIALEHLYTGLYNVVNSANMAIELLGKDMAEGMPETRKEEMLAECRFHRAMAHFTLLRIFGQFYDLASPYGIILRSKPFRGTETAERNNVADCYTHIITDLKYAAEKAPETTLHYYVSRITAKGLLARVYLCQKNYPEAAEVAAEVIREAPTYGYNLENDYATLFTESYDSPETLFAAYTMGNKEQCEFEVSRTSYSPYSYNLADNLKNGAGNLTTGEGIDSRFQFMYIDAPLLFPSLANAAYNNKYPYNIIAEEDEKNNTYIFMRLAEVYLIHAEAEARQGSTHLNQARNSLKVITDRAGYDENYINTIPDSDLLEKIRQHKWMELLSENYEEWFDLVRYYKEGNLNITSVKTNIKNDSQLILPIPKAALAGNNLLVQNP